MHMRSTLELPDELVEDAKRLSGLKTKRAVVHAALREFVNRRRRDQLRERLGKTDLRLTQEDLERMRAED